MIGDEDLYDRAADRYPTVFVISPDPLSRAGLVDMGAPPPVSSDATGPPEDYDG